MKRAPVARHAVVALAFAALALPTAQAAAPATPAAPAASAPAPSPSAQQVRGEALYARCQACHALAQDRVGPRHCGLFGRTAGSLPGYAYSDAMKRSHIIWDAKTLDRFLTKPLALVPGSSMTYDGIADAQERADLIAYLKAASAGPDCMPIKEKTQATAR